MCEDNVRLLVVCIVGLLKICIGRLRLWISLWIIVNCWKFFLLNSVRFGWIMFSSLLIMVVMFLKWLG